MTLTVPDFHKAHVAVAGDVMLDRYWFGPTQRVSPEAPVPVVRIDDIEERPGGGANVAVNLASLGVRTRLFGLAGADEAADRLQAMLAKERILTLEAGCINSSFSEDWEIDVSRLSVVWPKDCSGRFRLSQPGTGRRR